MQVQISLMSNKGYRALSTLIEVESWEEYMANKAKWQQYAVVRICAKRYMTLVHLKQYGYNEIRARVYDKERIAQQNKERYEQIKKERGWA